MTRTGTNGTAEPVTTPVIPADDRTGDGYDWMDTLEGTVWSVLPAWDSDGCDAGSWPCIIYAVARTGTGTGDCSATEPASKGDTFTLVSVPGRCSEAVTAEDVLPVASCQSDGPDNLPATAAQLPAQDRKAYPGWTA
ncbi:hypothetical protein AHiyo6_11720 [Arthrobacter sp. Hiyo6]|nr:hypothetical protein AHiyo6_11720 [Arthrobacter sp. Hiyo6]